MTVTSRSEHRVLTDTERHRVEKAIAKLGGNANFARLIKLSKATLNAVLAKDPSCQPRSVEHVLHYAKEAGRLKEAA